MDIFDSFLAVILTPTAGIEACPGATRSWGRGFEWKSAFGIGETPHLGLDIGVAFGLGNNRRLGQVTPYQHHVSVAVLAKVSCDTTYLEDITLLLNPRLGDSRLHLPALAPACGVSREVVSWCLA